MPSSTRELPPTVPQHPHWSCSAAHWHKLWLTSLGDSNRNSKSAASPQCHCITLYPGETMPFFRNGMIKSTQLILALMVQFVMVPNTLGILSLSLFPIWACVRCLLQTLKATSEACINLKLVSCAVVLQIVLSPNKISIYFYSPSFLRNLTAFFCIWETGRFMSMRVTSSVPVLVPWLHRCWIIPGTSFL